MDSEATDREYHGCFRATALPVQGDLFVAGRPWCFSEIKRSHCHIVTFHENLLCEDWHDSRAELTLLSCPEPGRPREEREGAVDLSMPPLRWENRSEDRTGFAPREPGLPGSGCVCVRKPCFSSSISNCKSYADHLSRCVFTHLVSSRSP